MTRFWRNQSPLVSGYRYAPPLTIRWATPEDAERLEILAEVDEAEVPSAPLLVGLVDDELWVAVSLSSGAAICDPFRPSADVAGLVTQRGRQLIVAGRPSPLRLARWRRRSSRLNLEARLGEGTS
jgi:hypothetical protein